MRHGGKRLHLEATRRRCRTFGAEFTANRKPGPDCVKGKWRIELKIWPSGRCLDKSYYEDEVAKGANWIDAPCHSETVKRLAREDGVRLTTPGSRVRG